MNRVGFSRGQWGIWTAAGFVVLALVLLSGVNTATANQEKSLCSIEKLSWTARGENYEPVQTHAPGSDPRHVSDDEVSVEWWPAEGKATLEWEVQTYYPFPNTWTYTEQFGPEDDRLQGKDGFMPNPDNKLPPARRMARISDLWLRVPAVLRQFVDNNPKATVELGYTSWAFDPTNSGKSTYRMVSEERDPPRRSVRHELIYHDYTTVKGFKLPARVERRVGGELIRREYLTDWKIQLSSSNQADCLKPGKFTRPQGSEWASGMTHWFLRRIAMGAVSDKDLSQSVKLKSLGDNLYQVLGSSHHNLLIVTDSSLVIVDASLYPERSEAILEVLSNRWPDRELSHVILTHHHHDHTGGLLPYMDEGAKLWVGEQAKKYFENILRNHEYLNTVTGVDDQDSIIAGDRKVDLHGVPNSHSDAALMVHVPDADHVFVTDLYNPGRSAHHPLWAQEFYRALLWEGLDDVELSGGHGKGSVPFQRLEDWVEKNGARSR